ncbi:prostaglandin E2 receptor EP2 subtype-like isoform X1 [Coregonus clupeaformis]|uniref:prostaglandin E2 receptor EP2 subtype-like isoform X1 n=2 Tax=Coregonus clupeaformis TaxID=59861 RepID=UPI001E1C8CDE|nr:prostaglandin E2 receptor EP2 subtype-like isoform X1 [Coregonus clupeaformis]
MDYKNNITCRDSVTVSSGNLYMSAAMFSAGVLGNLIALVLLEMRRRRQSPSLFQVLVTAMVFTDLLGTFSVSPLVLASYTQNRTLVGMSENGAVCAYFGFSMTFLSLATLAILCAMALERYLSFGHPYFYERHLRKRCGYITITLIYLICIFFCLAPFVGFGDYVQYCPGTWCFFDMIQTETKQKVYVGVYASLTLIMISTTVVCNLSVVSHLIMMYRRCKARRGGFTRRIRFYQRSLSMTEEVEHLLLLVFITVAFVICSFPLVLHVLVNLTGVSKPRYGNDLAALRLLSFNSIIDPWLFIILSPSVLRFLWRKLTLCKPPEAPTFHQEKPLPVGLKLSPPSPPMELQNNEVQRHCVMHMDQGANGPL